MMNYKKTLIGASAILAFGLMTTGLLACSDAGTNPNEAGKATMLEFRGCSANGTKTTCSVVCGNYPQSSPKMPCSYYLVKQEDCSASGEALKNGQTNYGGINLTTPGLPEIDKSKLQMSGDWYGICVKSNGSTEMIYRF